MPYDAAVGLAWAVGTSAVVVPPLGTERAEVARRLSELARTHHLVDNAELIVRPGRAADEVIACANEIGADLIVVGAHRRGAIARLVLGSVAQAITQRAPIPVLTVR